MRIKSLNIIIITILFSCNRAPIITGEYYAKNNKHHSIVLDEQNIYVYKIDKNIVNTGEWIQYGNNEIIFKKWRHFNHCDNFDGADSIESRFSVRFDDDKLKLHYDLPECDFIKR